MFTYSFLAMTAYNAVKPITRSAFIRDLGADNLPYVLLGSGLIIGVIMTGYAWLMKRLPRQWGLPIVQVVMVVLLGAFWVLFQTGQAWVSIPFYVWGQILGLLLNQPVLDAGQHPLRPAPSQEDVRIHRRRGRRLAAWRAAPWR